MHVCTELKKSPGSPRPPPSGDSAGGGTTQKWENEIHSLSVWENGATKSILVSLKTKGILSSYSNFVNTREETRPLAINRFVYVLFFFFFFCKFILPILVETFC